MSSAPMTTVPEELIAERAAIADYLRYCASNYPESSDGRNTFVMAASWVEARTDRSAAISPPIDAEPAPYTCPKCGSPDILTESGMGLRARCRGCGHHGGAHTFRSAPHPAPIDGRGEAVAGESYEITHDGFSGTMQGSYVTREGKRGVVLQQHGTRVVHIYGERWLIPSTHPAPAPGPADAVSEAEVEAALNVWLSTYKTIGEDFLEDHRRDMRAALEAAQRARK